jgi:hypothetical protein
MKTGHFYFGLTIVKTGIDKTLFVKYIRFYEFRGYYKKYKVKKTGNTTPIIHGDRY